MLGGRLYRLWALGFWGPLLAVTNLSLAQEGVAVQHQPPYRLVEVEGQAPIVGGNRVAARDAARADAVRKAVEQVVGVYVSAESLVRNFELIRDEIYARSNGFALIEEVLSEGPRGDVYLVRARVKVFLTEGEGGRQALAKKLKEMGLLRQIRVMVVISGGSEAKPVPASVAETALARALVRAGFKTVDKEQTQRLRESQIIKELLRGDIGRRELYDLSQRYGADVMVVGEVSSQRIPPPGALGNTNFVFYRARLQVKAISTETGEVVSADIAQGAGYDLTEELAEKRSIEEAADQLASRLIDDLLVGGYGGPGRATANVELEIRGWKRYADARRFLEALAQVRGIRRVHETEFKGGVLFAEVEIDQELKKRLGIILEELPGFQIQIEATSGGKVEGVVKGVSNPPGTPGR